MINAVHEAHAVFPRIVMTPSMLVYKAILSEQPVNAQNSQTRS